jgi:CheY-like chemotaxis protein/HPt (histidine-containing phosphotransfer) domain-containing protein
VINDILDFSKIEANKLDTESISMSVCDVVESACDSLSQMAIKKDVRLGLFVDPAIPDTVMGDPGRLRQVLINLTNNAIKFSAGQVRSGQVSVRVALTQRDEKRVMLTFHVVDNGIGIDEATRTKLFTAFTQADTSTTRKFGGTGLGLAISSQLVHLMGGEIEVFSGLEHGSDFSFCLPFLLPAEPSDVRKKPNLVSGLSCLVMASPEGLADDVATYLRFEQMLVSHAADLASAQRWMQANEGGLVVAFEHDVAGSALSELHAQAVANPKKMWRFISIGDGRRRRPRRDDADLVSIDGNLLTRKVLVDTIAVAAGRSPMPDWNNVVTAVEPAAKLMSREAASSQGSLILIAEDNEYNQKVILQQLMLLGRTADVASNGQEALRRWQTGAYAMLITDLHMPLMDGYELTTAIRAAEQGGTRKPIIAFTANALKGEAERCKAFGMDDYLSKPVQLVQLKAMLKKWQPVVMSVPFTPSVTVQALPAVDVKVLEALIGNDPAVVREFLQDFLCSAVQIAAEINLACQGQEALQAGASAHKLKSAARSVGAQILGDICSAMEAAGKQGNGALLATLLPQFEQELARVETFIQFYDHVE